MSQAPPDWYPDPEHADRLRFWDGVRWTEHWAPQRPPEQPADPARGPYVGDRVRLEAVQKALADFDVLVPGEEPLAYARSSQFSPLADSVAVTSARLIAIASRGGPPPFWVAYPELADVAVNPEKGTMTVVTRAGRSVTFKSVAEADLRVLEPIIRNRLGVSLPPELAAALAPITPGAPDAPVPSIDRVAARRAKGEGRASERADHKAQKLAEKAAREASTLDAYGSLVGGGAFGGKSVEFYDKGYVRVALWPTARTPFEKLVAIESSGDIAKKSAAGRAAGAIATGGLNLLSSNKRGDMYLTIVTETGTHVLHVDPPTALDIRSAKRLEGVGRGLLLRLQANEESSDTGPGRGGSADSQDPAMAPERLRQLAQMRDEGLISPEEYESLRAKILDAF